MLHVPSLAWTQGRGSTPAALTLGAPTLRVSEPFSEVVAAAELPDGRVLVADRRERTFYLVAADGGAVSPFGRNGRGPNEYVSAFGMVRMPGDTLALYGGNQRFLRVRPDGTFGESIDIGTAVVRGGGLALPRGVDASSAFYWTGDIVGTVPGGVKRNQRLNVRRWRPGATHIDTVATVADHAEAMHDRRFHPFAARDAWVVASDGSIGVLSAAEYRLRWIRDGRTVREGPALPYAPIPIEAADRAAFRAERLAQPPAGVRMTDPSGRPIVPSAAERRSIADAFPDAMFPPHKPPFVEDGLYQAPSGELWVVRSNRAGEKVARIDVLAASGERVATVDLPSNRRLVALERRGVWTVRTDDEGLQWLERHAWPRGRS